MRQILRARYVFPVIGEPIADGGVCIDGDRIVACVSDGDCPDFCVSKNGTVPFAGGDDVLDLGNAAILPGLVNAHIHLDFSDLAAPLGHHGIPFVDWLRLIRAYRQQSSSVDRRTVAWGLAEILRSGVTALGDIVQLGAASEVSPAHVTAFLELIAPTADRVAGALEAARVFLNTSESPDDCHLGALLETKRGLSPHAPYSVRPELLSAAVDLSRQHIIPLAMHLAESAEEIEFLRDGSGPLRDFLEEIGAWDATAIPRGARPLDYLRVLAEAHRALVVHGNYLDDEEIAFLGANRERMSAVYCPRSHDWFGHRAYPLKKLLDEGANVALGTDGRGSSPDLGILNEMRFAAQKHPDVPKADILKMGTLFGARALGMEMSRGSLSPGHRSDLTIAALPNREAADPHELLFDAAASVVGSYCGGQAAYRSGNAATS